MTKLEELIELAAAYERAPYPAPGSAAVAHAAVEALDELREAVKARGLLRDMLDDSGYAVVGRTRENEWHLLCHGCLGRMPSLRRWEGHKENCAVGKAERFLRGGES
jgi:hypothetical protein